MKKLLILSLTVSGLGLVGCSDPEPRTRVVHRTTVIRDRGPYVSAPTNERAEDFQANTKPDRY